MAKPIEIVPPRQSWPAEFTTLKRAVLRAAPAGSYAHHIGSTAVTGLAAKDVIDLQVTVVSLENVDDAAFAQEGFERVGGLVDHCPAGLDLAHEQLRKRFYRSTGRPANVHVREGGRFNQRFALVCRDFLRAHPTSASAYALIKQRLAARFATDPEFYYQVKDPIFDIIVDGASEWAGAIGWSEPPAD